jgi:[ribosomal protein S18]-alanine N-acetyltransferase
MLSEISPPFSVVPLTEEYARDICTWRYDPPYDLYNWHPWEWLHSQQKEFGDPEVREAQYRAVLDRSHTLCGYAQLFPIVGVTRLGLGMKPELCGQGLGVAFVRAIAEAAQREAPGNEIDLEVLTWNTRAIRTYERAGFVITDTYERGTPTGPASFHCMVWEPEQPPVRLPEELHSLLQGGHWTRNTIGRSGSGVFRVTGLQGLPGEAAYLKVAPSVPAPLTAEKEAMLWLQNRLPVPKVLYFEAYEGRDYLLMSEVPGKHAAEEAWRTRPEVMVRGLAEGLRSWHELPIAGCPLNARLHRRIAEAVDRIEQGLVDEGDFEEEYVGKAPIELLQRVQELSSQFEEDPVVTHGDYCLPNVVLGESGQGGFIDLGRAGVADRYQDLALAVRSLRHNGYGEWTDFFLTQYGLDRPDPLRMECYLLLDELY